LVAGWFHTCGLTSSGDVYCWGDNSVGQAGDGSVRSAPERFAGSPHPVPTRVVGSIAFSSIAAALTTTCGMSTTGEIHCWGENSMGTLGRVVDSRCRTFYEDYPDIYVEGDNPCSTSPVRVVTAGAATSIAGAGLGICAVLATRELQCWGFGEAPSVVPNALVDQAWVLWSAVCGLEAGGAVTCWRLPRPFETMRPFGDNLTLVNFATSGRHTCGLTPGAAGKVYCWGANFEGALGDGTTRHRDSPAAVVKPIPIGSR
ncbi:MAG: RCC1 domain-containing protein, partial [Gemmatimonadaceae bacterium]